MKSIQINIPDNYFSILKEFISKIPNSTFEENINFELSEDQIEILEQRSKMPDSKYITIEEANNRLKSKYV